MPTATSSPSPSPQPDSPSPHSELAGRELARRRLLPLILQFEPHYLAGWVHKDICMRLETFLDEVAAQASPRLMLSMPPRHGKSTIASKYFPSFVLGRHPDWELIAASYSTSLASYFSREVRQLLREPRYLSLYPGTQLDPDAQSVENWSLLAGGSYTASGVGSGITGRGAHILLIDDPIKNMEEAESAQYRETLHQWYQSVAYTRLAPGGGVILIQTRWHTDDLAGRLEKDDDDDPDEPEVDHWTNIKYPAVAEDHERYRLQGEALHTERYDLKALRRIRRVVGPRTWSALYQQEPVTDKGAYFKREWFRFYDEEECPVRSDLRIYAAWDLAIGKSEVNDYTVGVVVGVDRDEDIWVLDMVRGRWSGMEIVDQVCMVMGEYRPYATLLEKGHIQMAVGPYLEKTQREMGLSSCYVESMPAGRRDKQARARSIQGRMEEGRVYYPVDAAARFEVDDMVTEMITFPYGANDDIVDALAWIGVYLTEMIPQGLAPTAARAPSWRDKLGAYIKRYDSSVPHKSSMSA